LPAEETVNGITRAATTATVDHTAHGLSTGMEVVIAGAVEDEYNGIHTVTVTTVDEYTYTVSGAPDTPASGTITSTAVILNGTTNASGIIQDTGFNYTNDQDVIGKARKGSATPLYKTAVISGTIDGNGFTTTTFLVEDE
jgi:hypothetical protein